MSNQENQEQTIIKQYEEGIFMTEYDMQNMKMERFVVSNEAIISTLRKVRLTKEEQQDAVDALVHRTPEWEDLETSDQVARIKSILTMETIVLYLQARKYIRANSDLIELGVDQEGSVVIYVFYTGTNRAKRRAMEKQYGEEGVKEMVESTNFLGGQNIIDLAKKKLERMQAAQASKVKEPKKKDE